MKLASLKNETFDGQLLVVSRNLEQMVSVESIAPTLQYALDHWATVSPKLQDIYQKLNLKTLDQAMPYDPKRLHAPLPRAYQWADGSAYLHHVQLVRKARGADMPQEFLTDPLMYQGGSDDFLGPKDDIPVADEAYGIDFEAEVTVITNKVAMGSTPATCKHQILLLMLVNDVTLRELIPQELAKGFGFFHGKPASSFSPVAITPDELGDAWDGEKLHLPLQTHLNGKLFGCPNTGIGMQFSFPELIAHAAKTRNLAAGTIIGSGTISNDEPDVGSSCIVERRVIEIINQGKPSTPYMKYGDKVRIEMVDKQGQSLFGAIEQTVIPYRKDE